MVLELSRLPEMAQLPHLLVEEPLEPLTALVSVMTQFQLSVWLPTLTA
jgi:hypothetical protein